MNRKISVGITLALICISIAATAVLSVKLSMKKFNGMVSELPERVKQYSSLEDIDELVRANYNGDVNPVKLNAGIVKGYIEGLNDEYSFYIPKDEYPYYVAEKEGNRTGTGLSVNYDSENACLTVKNVVHASPAEEQLIQPGFLIYSVDGENVCDENALSLIEKLDDDNSDSVEIEYSDAENSEKNTVKLSKGYRVQSVDYSYKDETGYIRISSFFDDTAVCLKSALDDISDRGITDVIIDLRNNSGINYSYCAKAIDVIVPMATEGNKAIAVTKDANGNNVEVFSADSQSYNLNFCVLINNNTDGPAELFATDLKDFFKAVLLGEKTAGHGTAQTVFELDDGGAVQLSVATVYPYISPSYDKSGVLPDIEVIMSAVDKTKLFVADAFDDVQLKAAYSYFSEQ